ncbi:hypothetical protein [Occallatibacter riparius]|uniref:Uncharacterized protein n=1 Tax=Occallatibacter riparius TaxID=1002689 RepID=A0A9J7BJV1_9BACT|nr:hypothetical protein [Occallatibacter riparius]UWZ83104.1 hypothetical protein MOP44_21345 [Occallatibacter riparius]
MATAFMNQADPRSGRGPALWNIFRKLQIWWLFLIASGAILTILLLYAHHRQDSVAIVDARYPHASEATLLALMTTGALFLAGILLSTIKTERKAAKEQMWDHPFVWMARLRCMMALGITVLIGFAVAHRDANPVAIACVAILTAGAAWVAGMLLGFIFGLPQPSPKPQISAPNQPPLAANSNQPDPSQAASKPQALTSNQSASAANSNQPDPSQAASKLQTPATDQPVPAADATKQDSHPPTNLDQIGDWLTKLILGAGLTQIAKLPGGLDQLGTYIGSNMGSGNDFKLVAMAICVFFPACGFLFGYIWGRIFLPGAFRLPDVLRLSPESPGIHRELKTTAP